MDANTDSGRLLTPWPRLHPKRVLLLALAVAIYVWSLAGAEISPSMLARGIPNLADFVSRMMPPAWKTEPMHLSGPEGLTFDVPEVAVAIVETLQMAIVGPASPSSFHFRSRFWPRGIRRRTGVCIRRRASC